MSSAESFEGSRVPVSLWENILQDKLFSMMAASGARSLINYQAGTNMISASQDF